MRANGALNGGADCRICGSQRKTGTDDGITGRRTEVVEGHSAKNGVR
jgi:hypothetical protein